jgi:hypothetical protein
VVTSQQACFAYPVVACSTIDVCTGLRDQRTLCAVWFVAHVREIRDRAETGLKGLAA